MEFTLEQLAANHPYYCNCGNYYSNDAGHSYSTFKGFYDEWGQADEDMNLCFRYDIRKSEDTGLYSMEVFIMGQRKGKFVPIDIEQVVESDVPQIIEYLSRHWHRVQQNWFPFSPIQPDPIE